jgi:type I restriction enzyme, R subunit
VEERQVEGIPAKISGNKHASAYFGILKLASGIESPDEGLADEYAELSLKIERIVNDAVAEYSLSPQNIESAIRKSILPLLFKRVGLEQAKDVADRIVEVTKLGLAQGDLR